MKIKFFLILIIMKTIKISGLFGFTLILLFHCKDTVINPIVPVPINEIIQDKFPSWSPNGDYIAYCHFNPDLNDTSDVSGIYILNILNGKKEILLDGINFSSPDWSPNGNNLVIKYGDNIGSGLFIVDISTANIKRITSFGSSFFPRWSNDGNYISFGRSGSQDTVGLWIINIQNSKLLRLGYGASPADWSPDDKFIVYSGPSVEPYTGSQIWISDTSSSYKTNLTLNNSLNNKYPAWSPDGNHIAWTRISSGSDPSEIWLMKSDGKEQKKITNGSYPSWSPDSKKIVFMKSSEDGEKILLWSVNIDGSNLVHITN